MQALCTYLLPYYFPFLFIKLSPQRPRVASSSSSCFFIIYNLGLTLFICTGIVRCDFGPFDGSRRDDLQFAVPDENGSSLSISPNLLLNSAATVSLASIVESNNDQGTFAVDVVDILQSDAEEGQIFVKANLFVSDGLRINRVAYQVNLLTTPRTPIG